jgi:two-component system, LytTR family, response regulator
MPVKTIIVDDEPDMRAFLEEIIKKKHPNLEIIAHCDSVITAIKTIVKEKPDLVLLDIELPDGTGFDILESIPNRNFKLIFITSYNQYAVKAFKYSAIDYILKPIDLDEFDMAIQKAITSGNRIDKYNTLIDNIKSEKPYKIEIRTNDGITYESIHQIIRIEADGRYSQIFMKDGREFTVVKTLKDYEDMLDIWNFLRVHNSHLINLEHVSMFIPADGGYVKMNDGSVITISRNKKDVFLKNMKKIIV